MRKETTFCGMPQAPIKDPTKALLPEGCPNRRQRIRYAKRAKH